VCVNMAIEIHGSELSKIRAHYEVGCIIKSSAFIDRSNNQNFKNVEIFFIEVKVL